MMPIRPENRNRYPADWAEISQRIRQRADNKCEHCGVKNYALGGRASDGTFLDAEPLGEKMDRLEWPDPGTWAWCGGGERRGYLRIIRIVLTVAHLDHTPENCGDHNLRALCQRCHLRYDAEHHRAGIKARKRERMAFADLFKAMA